MLEKFKNILPINWELASNPVNWVIIPLMILLAGLMLAYIVVDKVDTSEGST